MFWSFTYFPSEAVFYRLQPYCGDLLMHDAEDDALTKELCRAIAHRMQSVIHSEVFLYGDPIPSVVLEICVAVDVDHIVIQTACDGQHSTHVMECLALHDKAVHDTVWLQLWDELQHYVHEVQTSLRLAMHPRVGANSAIRRASKSPLYEPKVWSIIESLL